MSTNNYTRKTWTAAPNGRGGWQIRRGGAVAGVPQWASVKTEEQARALCQALNAAETLADLNVPAQIIRGTLKEEQAHDDALRTLRATLQTL